MIYPSTCRDVVTGDEISVVHEDDCRAIERELTAAKARITQLEDIIKRADRAFFKDGSDGKAASAMLTVLQEALIPFTGIDNQSARIDKLEVYVEDLEFALGEACDLLSDSDHHEDRDKARELLKTKRKIA